MSPKNISSLKGHLKGIFFRRSHPPTTSSATTPGGSPGTLFSDLPTDLRLRIWRETWAPRVVNILREEDESRRRYPRGKGAADLRELEQRHGRAMHQRWTRECLPDAAGNPVELPRVAAKPSDREMFCTVTSSWAAARSPASLWVSREARKETLRHYELCLGLYGGESRVYFNFALDVLLLVPGSCSLGDFKETDLARVQRIMLWNANDGRRSVARYWNKELIDRPSYERNPSRLEKTLSGIKWELSSLREIILMQDGQDPSGLCHPVDVDLNSGTFCESDFRYIKPAGDEMPHLDECGEDDTSDDVDIMAIIQIGREKYSKVAEFSRIIEGPDWVPGWEEPPDWPDGPKTKRFTATFSVVEGLKQVDTTGEYETLTNCDRACRVSPGDEQGAAFGSRIRHVASHCMKVRLWNMLMFQIEIALDRRFPRTGIEQVRRNIKDNGYLKRKS